MRDFTSMMFFLYKKAHRPPLREISNAISRNDKLSGTASPETIRRMLRGMAVPQRWEIVAAVMETLCDLAGFSPSDEIVIGEDLESIQQLVDRLWHRALDYPNAMGVLESDQGVPDGAVPRPRLDPWTSRASGFSDEPPF
jgi:hypothetical protein